MSYTFKQIQDEMLSLLGKENEDANLRSRLKYIINFCYDELILAHDWKFLSDIDNEIVGTGVREYAVAADCAKVMNVRVGTSAYATTTAKLSKVNRELMLENPNGTTTATAYCVSRDGYIEIDVTVPATQKIYYDYKKMVSKLTTDSSTLVIPDRYVPVLKYSILAKAEDDPNEANKNEVKYTNALKRMIREDIFNGDEDDVIRDGYNVGAPTDSTNYV